MKTLRILVIDDVYAVLENMEMKLSALGHEVIGKIANKEDAIKAIKTMKPDLVFIDIKLGEEEEAGFDIARYMEKSHPNIPYIFLSKYRQKSLHANLIARDAYRFMDKRICGKKLEEYLMYFIKLYEERSRLGLKNIKLIDDGRTVLLKHSSNEIRVPLDNLIVIMTGKDKFRGVEFCYKDEKEKIHTFRIRGHLKKIMNIFRGTKVVQIHQSHAVHREKISAVRNGFVHLKAEGVSRLSIGGKYVHNIKHSA